MFGPVPTLGRGMWSRALLRHPGFPTCLGRRQLLGLDGARQSLPVQPQPGALHIHVWCPWGFGVSLGSSPCGVMEDDVLLSVLAGMAAVVSPPADNSSLTNWEVPTPVSADWSSFSFLVGQGCSCSSWVPMGLSTLGAPPLSCTLGAPVSPSGNQGSGWRSKISLENRFIFVINCLCESLTSLPGQTYREVLMAE